MGYLALNDGRKMSISNARVSRELYLGQSIIF